MSEYVFGCLAIGIYLLLVYVFVIHPNRHLE